MKPSRFRLFTLGIVLSSNSISKAKSIMAAGGPQPGLPAPEADSRLCMDLNVDNRACPGWSWEGDTRMAFPARPEAGSGAEWSLEGSGASCPVPGNAAAPAGSRGSF